MPGVCTLSPEVAGKLFLEPVLSDEKYDVNDEEDCGEYEETNAE